MLTHSHITHSDIELKYTRTWMFFVSFSVQSKIVHLEQYMYSVTHYIQLSFFACNFERRYTIARFQFNVNWFPLLNKLLVNKDNGKLTMTKFFSNMLSNIEGNNHWNEYPNI